MPSFAKFMRGIKKWFEEKIKCPTKVTVDLASESRTALTLDSLPAEIKLHIFGLPLAQRDLENLIRASSSFYRVYQLNRDVIATGVRLNELSARGIHLLHFPRLSIAYLEYWGSSPCSPQLEAALRSLLKRHQSRAAVLPPEQRAALQELGALIGWSVIPTESGSTAIKMSMFHSDKRRVIDHGYDETNYRLLCLVEPGTEADFEMMKTQWLSDLKTRSMKIYSKGKQIYFDKFGREFTSGEIEGVGFKDLATVSKDALLLALLLFLPLSFALRCFPPENLLPARRDCRAILAGLNWLSSRPNENNPRSWGRHLYTTRETERLPKVFKIEGRQPPNLCAVEVDVDPLDFMAIDTFRLSELVTAATAVFWGCLMGAAKIGLEYPGEEERGVWAKLNRIEYVPPMLGLRPGLRSFGDGEVGRTEGGERVLRVLRDGSRLVVREGVSVEMRTNTSTLARQ